MDQPLIAITARGRVEQQEILPGEAVVWIKPKMNYGDRQAINNEAKVVVAENGENKLVPLPGGSNLAALERNIKRWQGPGLTGKPVTRKNIEDYEGDPTLFDKVLEVAMSLNQPPKPLDTKEPDSPEGPTTAEDGFEHSELSAT